MYCGFIITVAWGILGLIHLIVPFYPRDRLPFFTSSGVIGL